MTAEQVHSNRVAVVGKTDLSKTIPGADALITAEKEVALAVRTADCVPVFLYDDKTPAVGLVHAGWRGTAMNITAKTLRTMEKEFGSRPEDVKAWIGPCIKACCYDCDLVELNLYQLIGSGIEAERVEVSPLCTGCEQSLFYSYRRDGSGTGRLYSLISIPI
ncbi:MAG: polyphenol oxidase family protein [Candidatus Margulisbacteria bacterium]|nr:polyphenol oxidase family protein [Candidatus Margulisiibacteriota bacterium]